MGRPAEEGAPHSQPRRAALADYSPGAIRPALGVLVQSVDRNLGERLQLKPTGGVVVADVAPDSPADYAGLQPGDVIVGCANQRVQSPEQLSQLVAAQEFGSIIRLDVVRAGGKRRVEVRLGAW
jgi:serine protease Do